MASVRIAVVQPRTLTDDPPKNVLRAIEYVERAAAEGARIVCLPETYPGPWTPPVEYDALPALAACAKDLDVYLIAGMIEQVPRARDRYYNSLALLGPDGLEIGRYRRTTPRGPWIYEGGTFWNFGYQDATDLPVFQTRYGTIGMLICSEVYVPELSRMLALHGAEIIFMPAGLWKSMQWDTWRTLMRARAIENLAYTATCQNVLGHESDHAGLAMVCSPEGVLAESYVEGVVAVDCDLDRIQLLRDAEDGPGFDSEKACKAGVFRQWYRPELYEKSMRTSPQRRGPQVSRRTRS